VLHDVRGPEHLGTSDKEFYEAIIKHSKSAEQLKAFQAAWVDVRDVALALILALEKQEAGGKRFLAASGMFVWQDWFDTVNSLGIPGVTAPNETPGSGKTTAFRYTLTTARAQEILGIKFRDMAVTAKDTILNFREKGWC